MRCVQNIVRVFAAIHRTGAQYGMRFASNAIPPQPAIDIGMYSSGLPKRIVAISYGRLKGHAKNAAAQRASPAMGASGESAALNASGFCEWARISRLPSSK